MHISARRRKVNHTLEFFLPNDANCLWNGLEKCLYRANSSEKGRGYCSLGQASCLSTDVWTVLSKPITKHEGYCSLEQVSSLSTDVYMDKIIQTNNKTWRLLQLTAVLWNGKIGGRGNKSHRTIWVYDPLTSKRATWNLQLKKSLHYHHMLVAAFWNSVSFCLTLTVLSLG